MKMHVYTKNGGPGAAGNHHRIAIIFTPQTPQSAILLGETARWRRHFNFALHFFLARKLEKSNNEKWTGSAVSESSK